MAKRHPKHKKRKTKQKHSVLYYINITILSLTIILSIYLLYQINKTQSKETDLEPILNKAVKQTDFKKQHQLFEEKTKALEIEYVEDNQPIPDEVETYNTQVDQFVFDETNEEVHEEESVVQPKTSIQQTTQKPVPVVHPKQIQQDTRPMLAILIDDVTLQRQIDKIQNIGYPITMAFLPPTKRHKNSAKIAKQFDIYMIHLPLEAGSKRYEETNTLHVGDSLDKIEQRIRSLKKLYPKAKYINNHTGSKFTADLEAMDKLLQILKKYDYVFVDSRTTSKTKTKPVAQKYHLRYISRNIFLDNKQDRQYIRNQLKKAVKLAKKNGSAIAIGHPHSITLKTLQDSKDILEGIHLIYINKL